MPVCLQTGTERVIAWRADDSSNQFGCLLHAQVGTNLGYPLNQPAPYAQICYALTNSRLRSHRQSRQAASMAAMSIFFIFIIASNAR